MQDNTNVGVFNLKAAMTAKELAAQIRYRGCVATLARLQAKNKVKEIIKAEGQ